MCWRDLFFFVLGFVGSCLRFKGLYLWIEGERESVCVRNIDFFISFVSIVVFCVDCRFFGGVGLWDGGDLLIS